MPKLHYSYDPRRPLQQQLSSNFHSTAGPHHIVLSGDPESLAPVVEVLTTPSPHLESLELLRNVPQFYELGITVSPFPIPAG